MYLLEPFVTLYLIVPRALAEILKEALLFFRDLALYFTVLDAFVETFMVCVFAFNLGVFFPSFNS